MTHSTEGNVVAVILSTANITTVVYSIDYSEYASIDQSISNKATKLYKTIHEVFSTDCIPHKVNGPTINIMNPMQKYKVDTSVGFLSWELSVICKKIIY